MLEFEKPGDYDITRAKDLYKFKMKDRKRKRGAFFSDPNLKFTFKARKHTPELNFAYKDLRYYNLLDNYDDIKRKTHMKAKIEKEQILKEKKKEYTWDSSYSRIKELTNELFAKNKLKSNPFNYNINQRRVALDRIITNLRQKKINYALQRVVLHFTKARAKIDMGKKEKIEEYDLENITDVVAKINDRRKKYLMKAQVIKEEDQESINSNESDMSYKKPSNIRLNKYRAFTAIKKNDNFKYHKQQQNQDTKYALWNIEKNNIINKDKKDNNNNNISQSSINDNFGINNKIFKNSRQCNNINNCMKQSMSDNNLIVNSTINNNNFTSINPSIECSKCEESRNPSSKYYTLNRDNGSTSVYENSMQGTTINNSQSHLDIKNNNKYFYQTVSYINNQYNKTNSAKNINKFLLNSRPQTSTNIINRFSCDMKDMKNFKNVNPSNLNINDKSNKRILSAKNIFRKKNINSRVINKPIYTAKIEDFINEFNRIRKRKKESATMHKLNHVMSYKDIDEFMNIREELQLFSLKQKFLKTKFKNIKGKEFKKKNNFINKMMVNVYEIDNPLLNRKNNFIKEMVKFEQELNKMHK